MQKVKIWNFQNKKNVRTALCRGRKKREAQVIPGVAVAETVKEVAKATETNVAEFDKLSENEQKAKLVEEAAKKGEGEKVL